MRTVAACAAPKDKAETMAAATSERESLEVRMEKLLWLKVISGQGLTVVPKGKACSTKLACNAAPKGKMSSLKS
jgi:hypothetical protein